MKRGIFAVSVVVFAGLLLAMNISAAQGWRLATEQELNSWIPARAPVVKERIETESRTASGIVDSAGRYVAGAVLITSGYSANGKYSILLVTQVPLKIGTASMGPGQYVFGWHRVNDSLEVLFYEAASGRYLGKVQANRDDTHRRIESFQVLPPSEHSLMLIGRFGFHYELGK
ncbi:MAG: hypothetical protein ACYCSP_06505 [Acidobacteriaceae bacterium]|jgi:hypothetical protein